MNHAPMTFLVFCLILFTLFSFAEPKLVGPVIVMAILLGAAWVSQSVDRLRRTIERSREADDD